MTITVNPEYGKYIRFYVAQTAEPAGDWEYVRVKNENSLSYNETNDVQTVKTKESGGRQEYLSGGNNTDITVQINHIYDCTGFPILKANVGEHWPCQIRFVDETDEEVEVEGTFFIANIQYELGVNEARSAQVTLNGGGDVVINEPRRAVNAEPVE